MNRTTRAVASLLGCAGILAGCSSAGGTPGASGTPGPPRSAPPSAVQHHAMSASAYRRFLRTLSHQEDGAHRRIGSVVHADSVIAIRKGFLGFAADQQRVSEELLSITPPIDAARANDALARAFATNAAAVRQVATALGRADSPKAALAIVMSAKGPQRAGQAIDAALTRLRELGYTSGS